MKNKISKVGKRWQEKKSDKNVSKKIDKALVQKKSAKHEVINNSDDGIIVSNFEKINEVQK
jgi:hypothetical protein